jgi:hypothetical protein
MDLCFSINFLATSIKKISIAGERVEIHKMMGSVIAASTQEITMYMEILYVKQLYRIQLDQMKNRDEVKALLAGHVNVVHHKKDIPDFWHKLFMFSLIFMAVLIVVLSFTIPKLITHSAVDWSLIGFSSGTLVVVLVMTFKNLLIQ